VAGAEGSPVRFYTAWPGRPIVTVNYKVMAALYPSNQSRSGFTLPWSDQPPLSSHESRVTGNRKAPQEIDEPIRADHKEKDQRLSVQYAVKLPGSRPLALGVCFKVSFSLVVTDDNLESTATRELRSRGRWSCGPWGCGEQSTEDN
jgi:hypothetical protein